MNEATKAMYAKILADAQATANKQSQPTARTAPAPTPAELPASIPTPAPAVIPQPQPQNNPYNSGKIYSLIGANGKTMQPIKQVILPIHCKIYSIGSEGDFLAATIEKANDNGRQKIVILSDRNPRTTYIDVKYMKPYSEKFGIGHYYADNFDLLDDAIISKYSQLAKDREQQQEQTAARAAATAPTPKPVFKPEVNDIFPEIATAPAEVKPQEPAPKTFDIKIEEYNKVSFTVRGKDTYPLRTELRAKGGAYNKFLQGGPAWIFSNKKYFTIKTFIEKHTA